MKKNNALQADLTFVKQNLGPAPALPQALSRANVEAAVAGKKQKKPVKRALRRAVAAAVAACIVFGVTAFWRGTVYAPQITADAASYRAVGKLLREYNRTQSTQMLFNGVRGFGLKDAAPAADGALNDDYSSYASEDAVSAPEKNAAVTADHGKTNTREADVAEEDVLQTDGTYLYLLSGGSFRVIRADGAEMETVAALELEPTNTPWEDGNLRSEYYTGFYLTEKYVIFTGTIYEMKDYKGETRTVVRIYDKSALPEISPVRTLTFDGALQASRFTDGKMIVVTQFYPDPETVDYNDYKTFIPTVCEDDEREYLPEDRLYIGSADEAESFTTVAMFAPESEAAVERCAVFGGGADVYCTARTLYIYRTCWSSRFFFRTLTETDVATNIVSFDISGDVPAFMAKGSVPGWLLNTFALDEYNGYLRAAATYNGRNYVYVLNGALAQVGRSAPLAEGEQIYGVRFSGDTAYVVTFYQTDPLFVLDLSDPTAPTLTGEVKLPGFSSYLHPVGNGLLLGLGRGGDENGTDGSAKASLFDVSDPRQPREVGELKIPFAWFHDAYKAFVDMGDGTYLIPYAQYVQTHTDNETGTSYTEEYRCGALRLAVENGSLAERGAYLLSAETYGMPRATFIGGTVYVVSDPDAYDDSMTVSAFDRDTCDPTGALSVPVLRQDGVVTAYNGAAVYK